MLFVLLANAVQQVLRAHASLAAGDDPLDGQLLGSPDDVLDHRPRREVLVVQDLLVAVLVGDFQELVVFVVAVHLGHRGGDHLRHFGTGLDGDLVCQVLGEDLACRIGVGSLDLDLHVQATGPQDGRVDEVFSVRGADDDHVAQALDTVDLGQ